MQIRIKLIQSNVYFMKINGRLSEILSFPRSFEERDIIDGVSDVTFYPETAFENHQCAYESCTSFLLFL
jgi:hypothetical protein